MPPVATILHPFYDCGTALIRSEYVAPPWVQVARWFIADAKHHARRRDGTAHNSPGWYAAVNPGYSGTGMARAVVGIRRSHLPRISRAGVVSRLAALPGPV
jgi:hypothetical protein